MYGSQLRALSLIFFFFGHINEWIQQQHTTHTQIDVDISTHCKANGIDNCCELFVVVVWL